MAQLVHIINNVGTGMGLWKYVLNVTTEGVWNGQSRITLSLRAVVS